LAQAIAARAATVQPGCGHRSGRGLGIMVIPLPSGALGAPMVGPPPAQLEPRFKKMKWCVQAMIASMFAKIGGCILIDQVQMLFSSSFSLIFNTLVGIFLLKDDPQIGRIYQLLATTCCQICAQNCQGGMSCLMSFVICSLITIVMDFFFGNTLGVVRLCLARMATAEVNLVYTIGGWLVILAAVGAFLAQGIGAFQGFKAYREAQDFGTSSQAGEWSGGGGGGAGSAFGGGGSGGYPAASEAAGSSRRATGPAFQPFSGGGQRLGGS